MSVKITDNTRTITNDTKSKSSIFLRLMADEIVAIALPKTPKKMGNLRRDILKQVLGLSGKIVWGKNYAAKQEVTQFKRYTTPGTGPHYAENSVNAGVTRTTSVAKKAGLI